MLLYTELSGFEEQFYETVQWDRYQSIFITTPTWFVTIPTEVVLKLSNHIKKHSHYVKLYFFANSLGWNFGYLEISADKVVEKIRQLIDMYNSKMLVCRGNSLNGNNLLALGNNALNTFWLKKSTQVKSATSSSRWLMNGVNY